MLLVEVQEKYTQTTLVANKVNIVSNVRDQKTLNETASSIPEKSSNINIQIVCNDVLRKMDAKLFWMFVLNQIY